MYAVTEFQARVIIVAERDRLDGYRARARGENKEREKIARERSRIVRAGLQKRCDNSRRNYQIIKTNRKNKKA